MASPPAGARFLFLDIDGVVSPLRGKAFDSACMGELRRVIERTGAKIVLSSTWRTAASTRKAVDEQLEKHAIPACYSYTPEIMLRTTNVGAIRVNEIEAWLKECTVKVLAWVAVDDMNLAHKNTTNFADHFVHVDSSEGLTAGKADRLIALLLGSSEQSEQ